MYAHVAVLFIFKEFVRIIFRFIWRTFNAFTKKINKKSQKDIT
jgi:hypothetical protein